MARSKSVSARRHRVIKKNARGFKQARRVRVKAAKEALLHAGKYAYVGRKNRKRDFRKLWIIRLNAASRKYGLTYRSLIQKLEKNKIMINRKILSDIAVRDESTFEKIIKSLK